MQGAWKFQLYRDTENALEIDIKVADDCAWARLMGNAIFTSGQLARLVSEKTNRDRVRLGYNARVVHARDKVRGILQAPLWP